jgi:hypothetical protein
LRVTSARTLERRVRLGERLVRDDPALPAGPDQPDRELPDVGATSSIDLIGVQQLAKRDLVRVRRADPLDLETESPRGAKRDLAH